MPTKSNNTGGRGDKRPGAGRKPKGIAEKTANGNPDRSLTERTYARAVERMCAVQIERLFRFSIMLHQNGKSMSQLSKEYGVSLSALSKWVRQYSEVKTEEGDILTARQIKELQKRNAQLEEENLILKKAIAIFTPHSQSD